MNELMAWHYTVGVRMADILREGVIRPATEGVPTWERPVVWFSTRQDWEPTATKGIMDGNVRRNATMEEMMIKGGLWRFGVPASELLPWGRLKEAARIRRKTLQGLVSAARKAGADPYRWYGSLEPVAMARCVVQCRMTADSEWTEPPNGA